MLNSNNYIVGYLILRLNIFELPSSFALVFFFMRFDTLNFAFPPSNESSSEFSDCCICRDVNFDVSINSLDFFFFDIALTLVCTITLYLLVNS